MQPDELESLAVRHVPGGGPPIIDRLGKGLINETYRVVRDGESFALRVAAANSTHTLGRRCAVEPCASAARARYRTNRRAAAPNPRTADAGTGTPHESREMDRLLLGSGAAPPGRLAKGRRRAPG